MQELFALLCKVIREHYLQLREHIYPVLIITFALFLYIVNPLSEIQNKSINQYQKASLHMRKKMCVLVPTSFCVVLPARTCGLSRTCERLHP